METRLCTGLGRLTGSGVEVGNKKPQNGGIEGFLLIKTV